MSDPHGPERVEAMVEKAEFVEECLECLTSLRQMGKAGEASLVVRETEQPLHRLWTLLSEIDKRKRPDG